ncbi:glucosaminidase domain-containing protein [Anaerocolumna chitinilytica]|uniref:Mannosyl-glycoprotein endo-beta-N-acetylglucosamidase-like domain-containing protein n=1 Tax=Anaerocolumna chitinilytica TaxID=1727145 RepID=A0A7I8DI16_9FIRM|nr:glucosaminidase domain-containing protein [Anaerocolumna chitinilytica]BCJ98128.1 hypothetical protein bsdcttw_11690 [Anaerocolumna chitinilytica]
MANRKFIEQIAAASLKYYPTYKILPSMTIAQACLESAWGKTGLAKDCNNFFGMKWTSSCGVDYEEYSTKEQKKDGTWYTIKAKFRKYPGVIEGIKGYYDFLNYTRYKNLKGQTDYREACRLIREDGWATDLSYTSKLVTLVKDNELWKFDLQAIYPKGPLGNITPDTNFLAIVWLQNGLNTCLAGVKGFDTLKVDGDYGVKTRAAVLLYWDLLGWNKSTGWSVGVNTKKALVAGRKIEK